MKKNTQSLEKTAQRLNNETARLAVQVSAAAKQAKKKTVRKKAPKKGRKTGNVVEVGNSQVTRSRIEKVLHPHLDKYFASLADPWKVTGVRCPVNYNPVPSFVTQYARTTTVITNQPLGGGTSGNLVIFPGHGNLYTPSITTAGPAINPIADLDEVAYHSACQTIAGGGYVVGPMPTVDAAGVTRSAAIGFFRSALGSGYVTDSSTGVGSGPIVASQTLPYTANVSSGHSRWKLVSMGLEIENVTPELYRGGSIISYQPINNQIQAALPIGQYSVLPTFRDHGPDRAKITWIPRMRDVAYWHLTPATVAGNCPEVSSFIPAISVCLTAPAANDQSYNIQVVCNWELAGTLFAPIGTPAVHMPETKAVIERVHTQLINTSPSASGAVDVAKKMYSEVKEGLGLVAKVLPRVA